jgi:hypothetical protein
MWHVDGQILPIAVVFTNGGESCRAVSGPTGYRTSGAGNRPSLRLLPELRFVRRVAAPGHARADLGWNRMRIDPNGIIAGYRRSSYGALRRLRVHVEWDRESPGRATHLPAAQARKFVKTLV